MLLYSDIRPSGSVNRLGGPKQEFLAASGDNWVEWSPLGVCPPSTIIQFPNCLLFICDLIICLYFVYEVCSVSTEV